MTASLVNKSDCLLYEMSTRVRINEQKFFDDVWQGLAMSNLDLYEECELMVVNEVLDVLMPTINSHLSSRQGFQWSRFECHREQKDIYRITSTVTCIPEADEDLASFQEYVEYELKYYLSKYNIDFSLLRS